MERVLTSNVSVEISKWSVLLVRLEPSVSVSSSHATKHNAAQARIRSDFMFIIIYLLCYFLEELHICIAVIVARIFQDRFLHTSCIFYQVGISII